ncbi:MAG TPA: helix-turn-helix transcriptional regulator [Mycobacteriales bacterium]
MRADQVRGHLDLLLLSVVADGPAHGYGVISALRERSGGEFDLPEGTVYPALHRLERAGLLVSRWADESGRRRRLYEITPDGTAALAAQRRDWQAFTEGVRAVLGPRLREGHAT